MTLVKKPKNHGRQAEQTVTKLSRKSLTLCITMTCSLCRILSADNAMNTRTLEIHEETASVVCLTDLQPHNVTSVEYSANNSNALYKLNKFSPPSRNKFSTTFLIYIIAILIYLTQIPQICHNLFFCLKVFEPH